MKIFRKLSEIYKKLFSSKDSDRVGFEESNIIENLNAFQYFKVGEIMIPRTDLVAIPYDIKFYELKEMFISSGHTRLPVYKVNLDDIVGFLHIKDFIACTNDESNFEIGKIIHKVIYIPYSARCIDLLDKMKESGTNISVVLDEYGGTEGIVTSDQLIEKILGNIKDEHEKTKEDLIQSLKNGKYIVDAKADIDEVESKLGISILSEDIDYETFGGFVLSYLDRIPTKGEKVHHSSGITITVTEAEPRRIKTLLVEKK